MDKGTVLTIDDDEQLLFVVSEYLEEDGYSVISAVDMASALKEVDKPELDVILLDLVLPDGEGMSLIPQIKSRTQASIIVVSGKSDTTEKVVCLEMGADDYMTKPFEMRELSARIKAVKRRNTPVEAQDNDSGAGESLKKKDKINFNEGWCLDRTQYQVYMPDGESADLTTGEFKLLEALILSANRALSREHLFDLTRDGAGYDVYDRAIDIQVARLRKKLKDDNKSLPIIKTVRGVGYMFTGVID